MSARRNRPLSEAQLRCLLMLTVAGMRGCLLRFPDSRDKVSARSLVARGYAVHDGLGNYIVSLIGAKTVSAYLNANHYLAYVPTSERAAIAHAIGADGPGGSR